jgi:hypothetical protein
VTGAGVQLTVALSINQGGAIAAQGVLPNGDLHAFLLIPCGDGDAACADGAAAPATQPSTTANPALTGRGMLDRFRTRYSLVMEGVSRNDRRGTGGFSVNSR